MPLDDSMIAAAREKLYTAVLSDALDSLGNFDHAMSSRIRPLDDTLSLFGRARTGLYMEVFRPTAGENPYELEIALVDDLKPGEVVVLACPPSDRVVPWGELLSTAARARGAAGCVTDGLVRDARFIRQMRFPVYMAGLGPLDTKGRGTVVKLDVPVMCGGVEVKSGDWVFGDVDGVVVIPDELADQTLRHALKKVEGEDTVREELAAGQPLKDVFARHGIL